MKEDKNTMKGQISSLQTIAEIGNVCGNVPKEKEENKYGDMGKSPYLCSRKQHHSLKLKTRNNNMEKNESTAGFCKNISRKIVVIVLMMVACLGSVQAQLHLKANVQNNHLWRGMEVSDGLVLLTDLSYTMAHDHVTLGLWGGTNTEGTYKEFNHYLNLKAGGWGFALWDTYNFSPGANYNNKEYWNYSAHTTGRFLDATLSYRFKEERFPLLLSWSTVIFGRDRNSDNTQQKYSTFVYAEYPIYKKDGWKVDAGVGGAFALNRAGEDAHFFGTTAGIVHVSLQATHDLKLGNYTLPVYAKGMWNPQSNESYFQIGAEIIHF